MRNKTALFTFIGLSFAASVSYFVFGIRHVESDIEKKYISTRETSVYQKDGVYRIDSNVILNDKNKLKLYTELKHEKLKQSFVVIDIPEFILSFLKNKSYEGHFHVADKCGEWMDKGTQPLVMKSVTKYDQVKKDSITTLELVSKDLPEKELNFFGIGENIALLALRNGGKKHSEEVMIIKFKDEKIIDFWFNGKKTPSLSIGEVIEFVEKNKERVNGSC
jgi:hypothetical protein